MLAYVITASLTTAANLQPFLAQSPPAWDVNLSETPQHISSPLVLAQIEKRLPMSMTGTSRQAVHPDSASPDALQDNYVSKIGILASSMPYYHNQYMELQKKQKEVEREKRTLRSQGEPLEPHETEYFAKLSLDSETREQSPEEQAATKQRLKPHSRSTLQLQYITAQPREKPEDPTQAGTKKHRTRWQFGIRSRNLPHEAIHCVYKALAAQKAEWEIPKPPAKAPCKGPKTYPVHGVDPVIVSRKLAKTHEESGGDKDTPNSTKTQLANEQISKFNIDGGEDSKATTNSASSTTTETGKADDESDDDIDPNVIPENYIPKDPWCIKVRWRKDGMYPPGTIHPSSAHSSRIDLSGEASRRTSMIGSMSSATASTTSVGAGGASLADGSCYVYMDVQLYTLEPTTDKSQGTFLVDFKCAGYESILEQVVNETQRILVGSGVRVKDKDVTSPQPFLDLTNKLVIHLAGGGN
jgi:carbon catabolite-derepressing protein kinase